MFSRLWTIIGRWLRPRALMGCTLILWLAACGGGGGGSGGTTPTPAAPSISYGGTSFTLNVQSAATLKPSNSGGAVTSWAIDVGLPAGLAFDTATGVISGTIASPVPPATFTVTASNAGGSDTIMLTVGAQSVLLTLGVTDIGALAISSSNLMAEEDGGLEHWVLWSYASGRIIAQGDACPVGLCSIGDVGAAQDVQLGGSIAVVPFTAQAFQILSASSGAVLATVKGDFGRFQAAPDGSFVCTNDANALTAWSATGTAIVSQSGNYTNVSMSCVAGVMYVANGPAGASVIEAVTVPGGQSSVSAPFAGTFNAWFADRSAFLTSVGNSLWVYSPIGTQLDTKTLATTPTQIGGSGQWFWTFDGTTLNIYKVGASAMPKATYAASSNAAGTSVGASGPELALWDTGLHVIDLSGATPAKTDYATVPFGTVFAATSATQFVIGSTQGALLDGTTLGSATPRYFGYGAVLSLAGTPTRLAVATASSQTLIFDTSNWSLITTLPGMYSKVGLSADGSELAALGAMTYGSTELAVKTISLPAGALINSWPYDWDTGPYATDITLSSSGLLLGQAISGSGAISPSRQVTAAGGGAVLWSDSGTSSPIFLSNDDTLIAVSVLSNNLPVTNIYLNDKRSTTLPGASLGWVGDDDVLQSSANKDVVYTAAGTPTGGPSLPALTGPVQSVTSDLIFDIASLKMYSLSSGALTFSVHGSPPDAVAGSSAVYVTGNQLVTAPY